MSRPSRRLSLRRPTADETNSVARKRGLIVVGLNRQLPEDTLANGEWSVAPEGKPVWRLAFQSTGAEALRLHFADFHVDTGSVFLLGTSNEGTAVNIGPYTKDGPFGDGEFWSDIVPGDSLVIAYEPAYGPAAESGGDAIPFRITAASHRFASGDRKPNSMGVNEAADEIAAPQAAAASCTLDIACYPEFSEPASAVALMIFESGGGTYQCSGSLIASASQPALPFFLTANHCIGTSAEARSLIAVFKYQTTACNGTPASISGLPRVTGATLLASGSMPEGDFSLLRLTAFPDTDVKVLGWNASTIAEAERVTSISHPRGDSKRIAFGQRTRDVTIRFENGERMPARAGYQTEWFQGVTQSGSSGSPLLANIDGKQYLVGTLSAGPDVDEDNSRQVCRANNLIGSYGRFSAAYPALAPFLTSAAGGASITPSAVSQSSITANPNPIVPAAGQTLGSTMLTWQAAGVTAVQVRVGSPSGPPMTGFEAPTGSAQTGIWVADGTVFYLQNASDGNAEGAAKTIAVVRVFLR
jgi:lysyl endopeptidase